MTSKLVRDKIPQSILDSGRIPVTHTADEQEYRQRLKEKLIEECQEFLADENPEELADILEVIDAIRQTLGLSKAELESIKQQKADTLGSFTQRIILDKRLLNKET